MPINLIVLVASLLITWLVFNWTTEVIKASVKTAFIIIVIVMALQITLGISPQQLWDQILSFPKIIQELLNR
ncbi:MAG: hypothetical protein ACTMUB_09590 [cyanobacterium endosymbiont of Rhopalodia musculus]|uniref:hypothetical protein n=1 Tax=cyanobacterium endosymbiont of Epithemia clementina EcSB TaxID=3034674 RepID=UPI00248014A5|nr:hypothetical protein [cyanobacterium endosymbiont of Epithemia clementina EcSB]WGT68299.1 hypothetical protein P3F56_04375 [cyanobacterium endosymbiont of Epithemia clementina EcSB]